MYETLYTFYSSFQALMNINNTTLGQVFTPSFIVADMIALIKNRDNKNRRKNTSQNTSILEPSAGDGAFVSKLKPLGLTALEFDKTLAEKNNFLHQDFFDFDINNKFDTIIGNPPYVRYQDIHTSTKSLLLRPPVDAHIIDYSIFDNRSNLFLFFIYKSILHLNENGELIFITPRNFLKATSSIKLNEFIYKHGTITDIIELGDKKIFKDAQPNTIIWRFEKNNFSRITSMQQHFILHKGQLLFTKHRYSVNFSDIAFVKVGAVSGADKYFEHKEGQCFVCSYTNKTGKTKKMIYNQYHPDLEPYKTQLLARKVRAFNTKNWFEWGRKYYQSDAKRIYVNNKTRHKKPFFLSDITAYDGSILAIFPKHSLSDEKLKILCDDLNAMNWDELGFVVDGRFIFTQKSLENSVLSKKFEKYKE